MLNDEYFMNIALSEAKKAFEEDEVPIGCVLVCDNKIIAQGHNTRRQNKDIFGHAEINTMKKANDFFKNERLDNCVLYVTIEPCPMCASAIQQAHIKRIVYGASDEKQGACGGLFDFFQIPKLNHYPFISSGVKELECKQIVKDYFSNKRKK